MHCDAAVAVGQSGKPIRSAAAFGFSPSDLLSAYGLPRPRPARQRPDDRDRRRLRRPERRGRPRRLPRPFGLPACTTRQRLLPQGRPERRHAATRGANAGWAQEIALDLDMVSAICPNCKILLVEASSPTRSPTWRAAVDTRRQRWAPRRSPTATAAASSAARPTYEQSLQPPRRRRHGVSSGDAGYGVEYPAASPYVTAVGGTTLQPRRQRRAAGPRPPGAAPAAAARPTSPSRRGRPTPAASRRTRRRRVGGRRPDTGVAVYDSYGVPGPAGCVFGGTSVAAPIVAGVYALAGNGALRRLRRLPATSHRDLALRRDLGQQRHLPLALPVHRGAGFDGPTGLGTPNGSSATGTTPAPSTITPIVKAALPSVKISRRTVKVSRGGTLRVRISCPFGAACGGSPSCCAPRCAAAAA